LWDPFLLYLFSPLFVQVSISLWVVTVFFAWLIVSCSFQLRRLLLAGKAFFFKTGIGDILEGRFSLIHRLLLLLGWVFFSPNLSMLPQGS